MVKGSRPLAPKDSGRPLSSSQLSILAVTFLICQKKRDSHNRRDSAAQACSKAMGASPGHQQWRGKKRGGLWGMGPEGMVMVHCKLTQSLLPPPQISIPGMPAALCLQSQRLEVKGPRAVNVPMRESALGKPCALEAAPTQLLPKGTV